MLIHEAIDIDQEETGDHGTRAKRDGDKIHLWEGDGIQIVAGHLDGVDGFGSPIDAGKQIGVPGDGARGQDGDQLGDFGDGGEADVDGGVGDVLGGVKVELVAEDVVEDGEADDLADGANGGGEGDAGADDVVGRDDGEDHLRGEEHAADPDQAEDERGKGRGDLVGVYSRHATKACERKEFTVSELFEKARGAWQIVLTNCLNGAKDHEDDGDPLSEDSDADGTQDRSSSNTEPNW